MSAGQRPGAARDLGLPPFRPRFPWLTGDLQTLRNFILRPRHDLSAWPQRRLWLPVSEGDQLAAALHAGARTGETPLVVLIHGLTGCEDSIYLRGSARFWLERGHPVLRLNLRGSWPSRPRCRGHYHAGRSADLRDALGNLLAEVPGVRRAGVLLVGFSLGGNMLIKFLAESAAEMPVRAAATVSAPIDLAATSRRFLQPRNALYHRWLLAQMKREALAAPARLSLAEKAAIEGARTVYQFDDAFVGPRHGFAGAADYYARCSGQRFLPDVPVPLLAVHAADDPWIPAQCYAGSVWDSNPRVGAVVTRSGGHVGFHAADAAAPWHDRAIATFFAEVLGDIHQGA